MVILLLIQILKYVLNLLQFCSVSSHMVADLCNEGDKPAALVLESPFTSIGEEVKNHMLSAVSVFSL